jgi:hypothetical protein
MNETPRVAPLKRVCARVEAESAAADPSTSCLEVTFIYGIGSTGMPPFECLLTGKSEGDQIIFPLAKAEAEDFFGHLAPLFAGLCDRQPEVFFRIHIVRVETADARDVVKAMAEMSAGGHGAGCDCGCGCG